MRTRACVHAWLTSWLAGWLAVRAVKASAERVHRCVRPLVMFRYAVTATVAAAVPATTNTATAAMLSDGPIRPLFPLIREQIWSLLTSDLPLSEGLHL